MKTFHVVFKDFLKVTPNGQPGMGVVEVNLEADGYTVHASGALMFYKDIPGRPNEHDYFLTIPPGAWSPVADVDANAVRFDE